MTAEFHPPKPALLRTLDAAGLEYDLRHASTGTPYAGFRWQCPNTHAIRSFTVLHESNALRLTLHEPLGPGKHLDEDACLLQQRVLPVARLYRNTDDGGPLELTAALPMSGVDMDFGTLRALMSHLSSNAEDLAGRPTGASRQAPPLAPLDPSLSIEHVLRGFELQPRREAGAFVVDMRLPGLPPVASFHVYHLGVGWIRVSAHLRDDSSLKRARLAVGLVNQLQLWAPVGRFVSPDVRGRPQLGCEVAVPALHRDAADVIGEALRAATRLLGSAWGYVKR